ncbi:polyadenylate-binding protein 8-like protein [Tanacetum coccineum]
MTTLADKAILSSADDRPPMLEKDMYDSWKSRMELYMMNRQHRRMILESVENGPLIWPKIKENGVTRPNKYSELFATKGRQISFAMGTSRTYTPGVSGGNFGKQRTVICYNCKGEGHMSKKCTKPKRKQDDSWFKDKVCRFNALQLRYIISDNVDKINMINKAAIQNSNSSAQQDALILSMIEQLKTK